MSAIRLILYLRYKLQQLMNMSKIAECCSIVLFAFAITSCNFFTENVFPTQTPHIVLDDSLTDRSIVTDTPCKAPCWYGLTLGKSTKSDVLATLGTLSFLDESLINESMVDYWDTAHRENIRATLIAAGCKDPVGQQCAGLIVANGSLSSIGLFPNYNITFQEIVDHLGIPDYIRVVLYPPTGTGCSIKLIWIDRQIIIDHTDRYSNKLCTEMKSGKPVDPALEAQYIIYILPNDIQLTTIPAPGSDYPWSGFIKP